MPKRPTPPSGRAGPLDGLPSGHRVAATDLPHDPDDNDCHYGGDYGRSIHCRGRLVLIHTMFDPIGSYDTTAVCIAHAISQYGVVPWGNPTEHYVAAVTERDDHHSLGL